MFNAKQLEPSKKVVQASLIFEVHIVLFYEECFINITCVINLGWMDKHIRCYKYTEIRKPDILITDIA